MVVQFMPDLVGFRQHLVTSIKCSPAFGTMPVAIRRKLLASRQKLVK